MRKEGMESSNLLLLKVVNNNKRVAVVVETSPCLRPQSDYIKNRSTPALQRAEPRNNEPVFRNARVGSLSAEISQIFTDKPVVSARKVTNAVYNLLLCCLQQRGIQVSGSAASGKRSV